MPAKADAKKATTTRVEKTDKSTTSKKSASASSVQRTSTASVTGDRGRTGTHKVLSKNPGAAGSGDQRQSPQRAEAPLPSPQPFVLQNPGDVTSPRRDTGVDLLAKQLAKELEIVAKEREAWLEEMKLVREGRVPLLTKGSKRTPEEQADFEQWNAELARLNDKERRLHEKEMLLLQRAQAPAPPPPEGYLPPGATPIHPHQFANPAFRPRTQVFAPHPMYPCQVVLHNFVPAGEEEIRMDPGLATLAPVATPPEWRTHYSASLAGRTEGRPLVERYNRMIKLEEWYPMGPDAWSEDDEAIIDLSQAFKDSGLVLIYCGSNQDYKFECTVDTLIDGHRTRITGIPDYIVTQERDSDRAQLPKLSGQELANRRCVFIEVESGRKGSAAGLVQLQVTMEAFLHGQRNVNLDLMYGMFLGHTRQAVSLLAFQGGKWYQDGELPAVNIVNYCEMMLTRKITPPPSSEPLPPHTIPPPLL